MKSRTRQIAVGVLTAFLISSFSSVAVAAPRDRDRDRPNPILRLVKKVFGISAHDNALVPPRP